MTVEPDVVRTAVVRRRTFKARTSEEVRTVVEELMSSRHTGAVQINMGQGAVHSILAEDSTEIDPG